MLILRGFCENLQREIRQKQKVSTSEYENNNEKWKLFPRLFNRL